MSSARELEEIRLVLLAQRSLLARARERLDAAEAAFASVESDASDLASMRVWLDEIERDAHLLQDEDAALLTVDGVAVRRRQALAGIREDLRGLDTRDWSSLVRGAEALVLRDEPDPFLPFEALLEESDLERLRETSFGAEYRWDRWDYVFVGTAGVLAALVDYFLVAVPRTLTYGGTLQNGSPLTAWLKSFDSNTSDHPVAQVARWMEERCKVPFDAQRATFGDVEAFIGGMHGRTHRLQSLGHDPALGLIFGVLDILRGTVTGFDYSVSSGMHRLVVGKVSAAGDVTVLHLIEAVLRWFGHMLSDVATPSGLPPPFFTLLQGLNVGSFGPNDRTVGELARWMYLNGYDLRHFFVGGIAPGVIELVVRGYLLVRTYAERGEVTMPKADNPKHRAMLLSAHAVAAAANAGKVALMGGNPVAINLAQWMALFRYLVPAMKYWVFDKDRLHLEHLSAQLDEGWGEIEANTAKLVAALADDMPSVVLSPDAPTGGGSA
jgi:hypothetical protein